MDQKVQLMLDRLVDLMKSELGNNLIGMYLHGSLAMGCYNPNQSDIDILVIVKSELTINSRRRIGNRLAAFREQLPCASGIELSILLETYLQCFKYPTPFELHYSDNHHERYLTDVNYVCGGDGAEDPDLAAHLVIAYHRGIALVGPKMEELGQPVGLRYYMNSIVADVNCAPHHIKDAPVYYTLNLCRVLCFLREGQITSKLEGGQWGMHVLPWAYHGLIEHCLQVYVGLGQDPKVFEQYDLVGYAEYMLSEINQLKDKKQL
ncbi:DUF4111 domain-containing protein [Paenibacillus albiflavus]|uniref:Spectinomycin 9-adenylyltransferase n=1 Tax=Paenibacillus albiflavus TaxID=2545760 RepID=A0A4R4ENI9_9BACL|nr:aminoglycoside adenylyltransferase domain-containing protein [Paenibacillus albiflavus]TCZ81000.1 DUF4111 domain-containing protein [Paenibacillus albiflavus]